MKQWNKKCKPKCGSRQRQVEGRYRKYQLKMQKNNKANYRKMQKNNKANYRKMQKNNKANYRKMQKNNKANYCSAFLIAISIEAITKRH